MDLGLICIVLNTKHTAVLCHEQFSKSFNIMTELNATKRVESSSYACNQILGGLAKINEHTQQILYEHEHMSVKVSHICEYTPTENIIWCCLCWQVICQRSCCACATNRVSVCGEDAPRFYFRIFRINLKNMFNVIDVII